MVSAATTKAVKPIATKSKTTKAAGSKANAKAAASHPSWKDMITECIVDHKDEARSGVSRATIKKYISEKYKVEIEGANASLLNRAIAHGAKVGIFALPKGPSGKVKLAPKNKPTPANENVQPATTKKAPTKASAAPAKKPAAKAAAPAKKTAIKKSTKPAKTVAKKTSSTKATAKKPAAKAAVTKATKSRVTTKSRSKPMKAAVV